MAERALAITPPEVWIDSDTACAITAWTDRWLREQSANRTILSRVSFTKAANGKALREYLLSSLPAAAQLKYVSLKTTEILRPQQDDKLEKAPLFAGIADPHDRPGRAAIPDELKPQADARFEAIEPLLSWKRGTQFTTRDGRTIKNTNDLAAYMAAQVPPAFGGPVQPSTIWNWRFRFREALKKGKNPFAALCDRTRSDEGHSRFFREHPEAALFIQNKVLGREALSNAKYLHEILCRIWGTEKLPEKGEPPSYATVAGYIAREIPKPLLTLAHKGPEALDKLHIPYILREKQNPMDWWIADHRVFDVRIRNTVFGQMPDEKAFRLWITAVYDWGSNTLVGWCFSPNPSSNTINSALRMAFLNYGMPRKGLYWDNGKDFRAVAAQLERIRMSEAMQQLLASEKIDFVEITRALPKRPRSKPIEAYFTRWAQRFDKLWRAYSAYRGNRSENRPEAAAEADKLHKKFLLGKIADTPLPTDRAFITAADQWIFEFNHQARLESLDGRTPLEVMDEHCPPAARVPPPRRVLDMLLSKYAEMKLDQGGCIEICKMRYEPTPESLGALFLYQDRRVVILRDAYDFSRAVAVHPETHEFIGELILQVPLEQTPHGYRNDDELKSRLRNQRALARSCRNAIEAITSGASIYGWQTEVEGLLERSAERLGSGDARALAAAPGSRQPKQIGAAGEERRKFIPDSPFVDDAAKKFISAMEEEN